MTESVARSQVYRDESVPACPEIYRRYPVVIIGDHQICAGNTLDVQPMAGPHMHSQVELNFGLSGSMTYWFNRRVISLSAGELGVFWGMVPHQVTDCAKDAQFVVLHVPMSTILELPSMSKLRAIIFQGAMISGANVMPHDPDLFSRWRDDLRQGDPQLTRIVTDEIMARVRRLDRDGWTCLRGAAHADLHAPLSGRAYERALGVEKMTQFIGEHASENIAADDVARAADLHPNYAMALFKRTVGLTIKQSIIRQRLDIAQSMLIASDMPVTKIAFDSGFGSLTRFYASFEKRFGRTPVDFRKSYHRFVRMDRTQE